MPILSSESALQSQLTMSLSPTRLTARDLPYSPTESICIIFKEIDSISNVMKRESEFARKIANNKAKTKSPIMTVSALAITVTMVLLLSLPALGVVNVWAANFVGTSGPDTIVGTDDDDKIFGKKGNDNLRGEGGDDYIAGNAGNDEIHDGLGSDKIRAGTGDDKIEIEGVSEDGEEGVDEVHGGKGKDVINGRSSTENSFLLIYGEANDDTITTGSSGTSGKVYGGSGNDIIRFGDCGGVAYGDSGDDELSGGDARVELHGGGGDDVLRSNEGGELFGDNGDDTLYGSGIGSSLTGGKGADKFICDSSEDTITDFNASEGDTKTEDCENVLEESVPALDNNDNISNTTDTATTTSTPTSGVAEDSSATEEDASSLPGTTRPTSISNNSTEITEATGTAEIQKTMEVLPDEEPLEQEQQQQDQSQ